MKPRILRSTYNVSAFCPICKSTTSFDTKHVIATDYSHFSTNKIQYHRLLYVLNQCASCGLGGYAKISDNGDANETFLDDFYPYSIDALKIPSDVPIDIQTEFREAEKCQAIGMNRAASALYRSVLEKTLKANGYTRGNDASLVDLKKRIDSLATDGVITHARKIRAHEDIRVLGNDVLHDDWREISDIEVEDAHRYMQRILEDLYDDRKTVETILISKGKFTAQTISTSIPTP
jgi:hypothetical protein